MENNGWSLREFYKTLETPGANKLRDAQAALDTALRTAYGMNSDEDILACLLKLDLKLAEQKAKGQAIMPPGLPAFVPEPGSFISRDCVRVPGEPGPDDSTGQSFAAAAHFYGKEAGPAYRAK